MKFRGDKIFGKKKCYSIHQLDYRSHSPIVFVSFGFIDDCKFFVFIVVSLITCKVYLLKIFTKTDVGVIKIVDVGNNYRCQDSRCRNNYEEW